MLTPGIRIGCKMGMGCDIRIHVHAQDSLWSTFVTNTVQLEVCITFSGRGMGMHIAARLSQALVDPTGHQLLDLLVGEERVQQLFRELPGAYIV